MVVQGEGGFPSIGTCKAALFASGEDSESWANAITLIRTAILNGVNAQAWLPNRLGRMVCCEVRATELAKLLP